MNIDWSKAPEGATHYSKRFSEFYKAEDGFLLNYQPDEMRCIVLEDWHVSALNSGHLAMIERPESTEPKQLTQSVFDGLPSEYLWAKILENGDAVAKRTYERNGTLLRIGSGYDTTDWQNSRIERQDVSNRVEQLRSIEEARQVEKDAVNNPSHYTTGGIECIDAMQAMLSRDEFIGYLRGNVFKYQWRYQHKNGVEDLKKARWYANRLIELESGKLSNYSGQRPRSTSKLCTWRV